MAGLKELRTRLTAVKSTKKITTAMKLVAAAKLKKAVSALEKNAGYAMLVENAVKRVLLEYQKEEVSKKIKHLLPPIFNVSSNPEKYLLLVFSSERGLCGTYNQNVAKTAIKRICELQKNGKIVSLICYGKKAYDILKKDYKELIVHHEASFAGGGIFYDEAVQMAQKILQLYQDKSFDMCEMICGVFQSAAHHETLILPAYPLDAALLGTDENLDHVDDAYFDYKPSKQDVLEVASQQLMVNNIYRAMLGAEASEQSERMIAMDNATRNAEDMGRKLTLKYNTLRQSAITTELTEIISGAEAL